MSILSENVFSHSFDDISDRTTSVLQSSLMTSKSTSSLPSRAPPSKSINLVSSLWIYSGPIIFVIGLCGNALILVVMTRRRMSGTSTSVHLSLMAIADVAVLCTGLVPDWIEAATGLEPKKTHPIVCKLEKFLFFTSGDTSIWILVIFTIDRFAAICFPLHRRDCCLPGRAKYYAASAFLLAVIKNLPAFWTRGAEYKMIAGPNSTTEVILKSNCGCPTEMAFYYETYVRPWIALTIVNIIPFCIILFCNIFIIRALFAVQRMRSEQAIVSASDKMTTMCLSASFCFLIFITPSIVLLIGKPYWQNSTNAAYQVAKSVNNQLVFVNHSINFFLYCITGRRFRQVIMSLFRGDRDMRRRGGRYRPCDDSAGVTTMGGDRTTYNSSEAAATMRWTSINNSISPSTRLSLSSRLATSASSSPHRRHDVMACQTVKDTAGRCVSANTRSNLRGQAGGDEKDGEVVTVRPTMSVVVEMAMTVTATSNTTSGATEDGGRWTNHQESGLCVYSDDETKV